MELIEGLESTITVLGDGLWEVAGARVGTDSDGVLAESFGLHPYEVAKFIALAKNAMPYLIESVRILDRLDVPHENECARRGHGAAECTCIRGEIISLLAELDDAPEAPAAMKASRDCLSNENSAMRRRRGDLVIELTERDHAASENVYTLEITVLKCKKMDGMGGSLVSSGLPLTATPDAVSRYLDAVIESVSRELPISQIAGAMTDRAVILGLQAAQNPA